MPHVSPAERGAEVVHVGRSKEVTKKWKKVVMSVVGVTSYQHKDHNNNKMVMFALKIESKDIIEIREDLGPPPLPRKMDLHVLLFSKNI